MSVPVIFILSVIFSITLAIPLDTTVPPDIISFTTVKEDNISPEIVATSSVEANEESSERSNVFMNEELELLAMNLPDIFRRDTSYVEYAFPIRNAEETLNESEEEEEKSHEAQGVEFPEPINDEKMEKRDVHSSSFKDTHSPDPNFPKYLNRKKRRISLTKF
ncbi:hypothetical protein LSTR_LSTR002147 [Laodelphax striatellus]|uniref:Uncharacterized protein n=1 Tax=Laodelphax striatellus TaxID=195883 RepID=A0A482XT17_LAOST|nr:hypothetical protein LSTR_LSTR002147 [Laodelphax striatellus]